MIAFGGTNGLAPVPGALHARSARSIGVCTAPSCDGTPRVVDADASRTPPSRRSATWPAASRSYIAEGFAHVDVLTAEDDADNPIPAALVDFIERNIQ